MADSFAETAEGILLVANGMDPVLRWDGLSGQMETAGIAAPTQAPVLSGSGAGPIVGTYYGYVRFLDRYGNLSNLSPISPVFNAVGTTGTITDASNATPIVITSNGHSLPDGSFVKVEGVGGNTSANNTWQIKVLDVNRFSLNGSSGTAGYTGNGTWTSGVASIIYTNLAVPTDPKVTRRQILRNTDGQADTFYVDIDTEDLSSTTFTSTNTDTFLAAGLAQPLFDADGAPLANVHDVPPNWKAVVVAHQDRMFYLAQHDYKAGNVKVTAGSTSVQGVGTEWTSSLAGRYLYVSGATQPYQITAVNTLTQMLTLSGPYTDLSDQFASYAIRPPPAEARLVYYSEAGQAESVPPFNALLLQSDGDEIIGGMAKGSFLYIIEKRHIYKTTFQSDPAKDGAVFLAAKRGCINFRCWVDVEGTAYMLDEIGIHAFDQGQESAPVGAPVQQIFRPGQLVPYKINWQASDYFFAVLYLPQEVIRWAIALAGNDLPRHWLAFDYRTNRCWIEEITTTMGSACEGEIRKIPTLLVGLFPRRTVAWWQGYLDGASAADGTVRGLVTSAGLLSLTDAMASFPAQGVVNSPLAIVDGMGKGQVRNVVQVSGKTLTIDKAWTVMPDTTSVYQIGGIRWNFRSTWLPWVMDEDYNERFFKLVFEPTVQDCTLDMRLWEDFAAASQPWSTNISSAQGDGVRTQEGAGDLVVDLKRPNGVVTKRFGGNRELFLSGSRYAQLELAGFTNQDQVTVYQFTFGGVTTAGGR